MRDWDTFQEKHNCELLVHNQNGRAAVAGDACARFDDQIFAAALLEDTLRVLGASSACHDQGRWGKHDRLARL